MARPDYGSIAASAMDGGDEASMVSEPTDLEIAAEDLLEILGDHGSPTRARDLAECLESIFEIMEAHPHKEGPHED